jgi:uncharacterized LabA/DUF88 family protein
VRRVRVYVDGFNLYYGMHSAFGRQYLWLDLESLATGLLLPGERLDQLSYFTARMINEPLSEQRQDTYLQALAARSTCLTIVEGWFQQQTLRCRACGTGRTTHEEKETDVSIAVTLVEDAARSAYDRALVISGDRDLCPAVRAAKRLQPARRIVAVFPPRRQSDPLRKAADGVLRVSRSMLRQAQLPTKVVNADGIVLERPAYWS